MLRPERLGAEEEVGPCCCCCCCHLVGTLQTHSRACKHPKVSPC
jgi:hypothetical protein